MDLRSRIIVPADGNLDNLPAKTLNEEKDLRIEPKPLRELQLKRPPCGLAAEELQPALGVMNLQAGKEPHEHVEESAGVFPPPGLVNPDQAPVKGARTYGCIGCLRLERGKQFVCFFDRRRKVGICEQHELATRFQNAAPHAEPFAPVGLIAEHAGPGPK